MKSQGRTVALAVGLLAMLALLGWLSWGGTEQGGTAASPAAARAADGGEKPSFAMEQPAEPDAAASLVDATAPKLALSPSGAPRLVVRVTWADRTPAEGILLHVFAADQPDPRHNLIDGLTDKQGIWMLEPAPLGTVGVYSDRDGSVAGKVEPGRITELALELPAGTLLTGRVLDPDEHPVPRAEIWLSDVANYHSGAIVATTDTAGRFSVRSVGGDRWVGARGADFTPSVLSEIPHQPPPEMQLELRLGFEGGMVRGVVFDAKAQPLAGAFVQVGPGHGWPALSKATEAARHGPPPFRLRTTAKGAFEVRNVPPGVVPIEVIAVGCTPFATSVDVEVGKAQEMQIQLERGATLEGVVRDGAGAAVPDAFITVGKHPTEPGYVRVRSGADGHYVLPDPPAGEQEFSASKKGVGEDRATRTLAPGQTLGWDPVLSGGPQILGRVVDESGAPVEGLQVRATHKAFDGYMKSAKVAADGRFVVLNCDESEHFLVVTESFNGPVLAKLESVRPGPNEVLITLAPDARLYATVVARATDSRGQPPSGLKAVLRPAGQPLGLSGQVEATTGDILFDKVPAGDYQLAVISTDRPTQVQDVSALRAAERRDLGTIVLGDPGRVILHVGLPAGVGVADVIPILDPVGGRGGLPFELKSESPPEWIASSIAPGEYILSLNYASGDESDAFIVPMAVKVRVQADTDARVDMFAERGVVQEILLATSRKHPPKTWLKVSNEADELVCDEVVTWDALEAGATQRKSATSFVARPGAYTLTVEMDGQVVVQQELSLSGAVNIAPDLSVVVP
jgi:Carboxypeptidase regulatory-like domain